jgi:hypothetical protein
VWLVAAPGWLKIRGRQRLLRGLAGRADGVGRLRAKLFVEELVQHLGAGLGAMADHHRGMRADCAGLGLTVAEVAEIADSGTRGGHSLDGANLDLWWTGAALGSSTSTTPSQNAIRNRESYDANPAALLKAALGGHHNREL